MPRDLSLNDAYMSEMRHYNKPFGIALYEPLPTSVFYPGCSGYFNAHGQWNPVVVISDSEDLERRGYQPMRMGLEREPQDDGEREWGPKVSKSVKAVRITADMGASASAAGIPSVSLGALYKYSTMGKIGAVLLTTPPIIRDAYYHEEPLTGWVRDNAVRIVQNRPEVREHGLWIVTATYSTPRCALNVWTTTEREITVAFKAKARGSQFGPKGEWFESTEDTGWASYEAKDDRRYVIFFCGLRFTYSRLSRTTKLKRVKDEGRSMFRGAEDEAVSVIAELKVEDEDYLLEVERFVGTDEGEEDDE